MTTATAIDHVAAVLEAVALTSKLPGFGPKLEHQDDVDPDAGRLPGDARRFWFSVNGAGVLASSAYVVRGLRRLDLDIHIYYPPCPGRRTAWLKLIWQDYVEITTALLDDETSQDEATTTIVSLRAEADEVDEVYQASLAELGGGLGAINTIQTSLEHRG